MQKVIQKVLLEQKENLFIDCLDGFDKIRPVNKRKSTIFYLLESCKSFNHQNKDLEQGAKEGRRKSNFAHVQVFAYQCILTIVTNSKDFNCEH